MEELFSKEWLDRLDQPLNDAAERIKDILSITPVSLIKEVAKFLGATHDRVNHGKACDLLEWSLLADVLVDFHNSVGYLRVSDDFTFPTLPRSFKIEWRKEFMWNDRKYHQFSSEFPALEQVEVLRSGTLFGDVVLFTALRDLRQGASKLYYRLSDFLVNEIRNRLGSEGLFLFERARYHQSIGDITARNKNLELKKDKDVLDEIATGLEKSKRFAKSKFLANLREKCQSRIHELRFIIPGELVRSLKS